MRVHRFYIGRETQHGKGISGEVWSEAEDRLRDQFGGFTRYSTVGQWKDDAGKVYNESSYVFECLVNNTSNVDYVDLAQNLARLCGQACVLYTWHDVQGEFVYA